MSTAGGNLATILARRFLRIGLFLILSCSLSEERVLPSFHLFWGYVFLVGGDAPLLAEWVGERAEPVSPEHVLQWHVHAGARRDCPAEDTICVLHV